MIRFHGLTAQTLDALLEQLKLNPTHSLYKMSPIYGQRVQDRGFWPLSSPAITHP